MNRRSFLALLSSLPFLGWLSPKVNGAPVITGKKCDLVIVDDPLKDAVNINSEWKLYQFVKMYWDGLGLDQPNEYETSFGFRDALRVQLCTCGNAYVWRVPDMLGGVFEVHIVSPYAICHENSAGFVIEKAASVVFIPREWMDHLQWYCVSEIGCANGTRFPIPLPPTGRIVYPKQTGASTAYWIANENYR